MSEEHLGCVNMLAQCKASEDESYNVIHVALSAGCQYWRDNKQGTATASGRRLAQLCPYWANQLRHVKESTPEAYNRMVERAGGLTYEP